MMKIATVLRKARNILLEKGWTKRAFKRRGRYCAVGAINVVCCGGPIKYSGKTLVTTLSQRGALSYRAENALLNTLRYNNIKVLSVTQFNDRKSTTKKDIIDLFNKTIKIYEVDSGI